MDQNHVRKIGNFLKENEIVSGIDINDLDEDISVFGLKDGDFPNARPKQIKAEFEFLFSDAFGDASKRLIDDIEFEPVVNDKLMCANCRH